MYVWNRRKRLRNGFSASPIYTTHAGKTADNTGYGRQ